MAPLLASQPTVVEPPPLDQPASPPPADMPGVAEALPVPTGTTRSVEPRPFLQRQLSDRSPARPLAESAPASPVQTAAEPSAHPTTPAETAPSAPTASSGAMPTSAALELDEAGYPPLIARSVQRSPIDVADAGPAAATETGTGVAADPPPPAPQAPLSGFTAAISALQSSDPDLPLGSATREPAQSSQAASHGPDLVVARRVAPDGIDRRPAPDVQLQPPTPGPHATAATHAPHATNAVRASHAMDATHQSAPRAAVVQRSLIADRSPLASPSQPPRIATPTESTTVVQQLHYQDVAGPTEGSLVDDLFPGPADPMGPAGEPGNSATAMATPPGSAAWSPVPLAAPAAAPGGGGGGWSAPAGTRAFQSPPSGAPQAAIQRAAVSAETSRPAAGRTPQAAVDSPPVNSPPVDSSPAPSADPPPMIQRRFDPPAPSTPIAPPPSASTPTMAVSSRTVGLAEMFAMAAAQSSANEATIQRSVETNLQLMPDDPAASVPPPSAAPSTAIAAPVGPTDAASPTGTASPTGAAGPPSGAELEEMVRRLYEPLSARLRAELWQDRERSGLLTDLRP